MAGMKEFKLPSDLYRLSEKYSVRFVLHCVALEGTFGATIRSDWTPHAPTPQELTVLHGDYTKARSQFNDDVARMTGARTGASA